MTVNLICSEKEKSFVVKDDINERILSGCVVHPAREDCNFFMDPSMTKCQQEYGTFLAQSRITSCNHW